MNERHIVFYGKITSIYLYNTTEQIFIKKISLHTNQTLFILKNNENSAQCKIDFFSFSHFPAGDTIHQARKK